MSDSGGDGAHERVVIEQRLLKIDELFIYRIPPMRSADGHRAEDWNLAKPLATCSLVVARRDNELCINIMAERPKPGAPAGAMESYLFAQSNIHVDFTNPSHKIEHWVTTVVDSSRYFAVRIEDSKSGREAFIGVGFRERTDATNFRMTIEDYINSLKREEKAAALHKEFEEKVSIDCNDANADQLPIPKSSLSLKEGEKLYINMKGKPRTAKPADRVSPKMKGAGGLMGLKKPPPPPDATAASDKLNSAGDPTQDKEGSTAAITPEEEDEWGDFEG